MKTESGGAAGNRLDLPLGAGASDVGCDAGVGRIYTWLSEGATGSGHLVSWAVVVVSKSMMGSWVPSTVSCSLLFSVNKAVFCSSFVQGQKLTGASCSASGAFTDSTSNSS